MEVSGLIRSICPPEILVSALKNRDVLQSLLPEGSKLDQIDERRFSFVVSKSIGPVRLTLPGQLSLNPDGEGQNQVLIVQASHIIGGKVDLHLPIKFATSNDLTVMKYAGTLEANGLAGRMINQHSDKVGTLLRKVMMRLKKQAETQFMQRSDAS